MTLNSAGELTPEGLTLAKQFLRDARDGVAIAVPEQLLSDRQFANPVSPACLVEHRPFANRRDAGQYLSTALDPLGIGMVNGNYALWSWLGMFFFDSLVDRDDEGRYKIGRLPDHAFVQDANVVNPRDILFNRLMLAWESYIRHGDQFARWMLDQPVISIPKLVERTIRSRQRFASHGIVKLIGLLYIDPQSGGVRRGAGSDDAVGGIRRLNDVLDQLYMTYDVYGMRAERLLALLPEEFNRFNVDAGSARRASR